MRWPVNPLGGKTINRRAVCGRTACTVRREGAPRQPALPTPIVPDALRRLRTPSRLVLLATPNPDEAERRGRHSGAERWNECFYSRLPIDGTLHCIVKWDHLATELETVGKRLIARGRRF
jgi:hypothetical protein